MPSDRIIMIITLLDHWKQYTKISTQSQVKNKSQKKVVQNEFPFFVCIRSTKQQPLPVPQKLHRMLSEWKQGGTKEIEGFTRDWFQLELIVARQRVGDSRPVKHLATIRRPSSWNFANSVPHRRFIQSLSKVAFHSCAALSGTWTIWGFHSKLGLKKMCCILRCFKWAKCQNWATALGVDTTESDVLGRVQECIMRPGRPTTTLPACRVFFPSGQVRYCKDLANFTQKKINACLRVGRTPVTWFILNLTLVYF